MATHITLAQTHNDGVVLSGSTPTQAKSMDFMSDSMEGNRKFRTFNVMDDCSREPWPSKWVQPNTGTDH